MGMDTADGRVKRGHEMVEARRNYEPEWQRIARLIRPLRSEISLKVTEGARRVLDLYDTTGWDGLDNFAGGLYGTLTNPANVWFSYATADEDLNRFHRVRNWLDIVSRKALASFRPSVSNFYAEAPEWLMDIGAFGWGTQYSALRSDRAGYLDKNIPISESYIDTNFDGDVDTVMRRFTRTARAVVKEFGEKNVSAKTKQKANGKGADTLIEIQHIVFPNEDYRPGRFGPKGKPFLSYYDEVDERHQLRAGGFEELPYHTARWAVAGGERYGRGPGMKALPHARGVNEMERTNLIAAQKAADPPLIAAQSGQFDAVRTGPGRITYGAVSVQTGRPLLQPLMTGANVPITLEMTDRRREMLRDAFYFSVMQLVGRTGMTATEIIERNEEKFRLMGPFIGRIQAEGLAPLLVRRFNMLMRAGVLPPPPEEAQGQTLEIQYLSPMAQAQKSAEAAGIIRTWEFVSAQAAAGVTDVLDKWNGDAAVTRVAEAYSAPAVVLRSDEEAAARRQQRQQLIAAQQAAELAKTGGQGLQSIARAGAAAQGQ